MPLFGARADAIMEINSLISPTRLVSSFTRRNKYLTGDRSSDGNYFMPLKTELKLCLFGRGSPTWASFSHILKTVGKSTRNSCWEGKLLDPYHISIKTSIQCSFVFFFSLFILIFNFFFSFTFNESPGCRRRTKRAE